MVICFAFFRAYELQILFTFCYQEQKWHHQSGIDDNSCWSTEIQGVQFSTKSIGYFKLLVYLCNTYVQHMYQRIVLVGNILTYILDVVLLPVSVSKVFFDNFSSLNLNHLFYFWEFIDKLFICNICITSNLIL